MENRVPIPTDNIYKFYALFSLLLFVFSIGSSIYVTKNTNDELLKIAPDLIRLEQLSHPTIVDEENKKLLAKKMRVTISDKETFTWGLVLVAGLSILGMTYGFQKWHTVVQPRQDRLLELQIRIAELQVERESTKASSQKT